jgi:hypothetical protein
VAVRAQDCRLYLSYSHRLGSPTRTSCLGLGEECLAEELVEASLVSWTASFPALLFITSHLAGQDETDWLREYGSSRMRAFLRDPTQNPKNHDASVEVEVQDMWLNYPNEYVEPGIQVGVLQYQIDRFS